MCLIETLSQCCDIRMSTFVERLLMRFYLPFVCKWTIFETNNLGVSKMLSVITGEW